MSTTILIFFAFPYTIHMKTIYIPYIHIHNNNNKGWKKNEKLFSFLPLTLIAFVLFFKPVYKL